jgi:hypothetical protein
MATRTIRGGFPLRLALAAALGLAFVSVSSAQVPGTQADVGACVACHYGAEQPGAQRFVKNNRSHEFIKLNESMTWDSQDPHQLAYEVLKPEKNPVAKKMQELLGRDDPNYKVTTDYRCLTCHATDLKPTSKEPRNTKEFVTQGVGVGCAACHGVTEKWQTVHYLGETIPDKADDGKEFAYFKWRTETPDHKWAAGMRNLRDPHAKADLCASCHVGNPDENKVVTHEIYAAGHPPLPPLELVTFMNGEPRHWGYPSELKFLRDFAKKNPEKAWEIFRFKPADKDNYLARHVAAGAISSLKAEMNLLAAESKNNEGLDYARFDCYSCHHDLKYPSARQVRGYEGRVPGRPPLKAWVAMLPSTVVAHAGTLAPTVKAESDKFPAAWAAVAKAATSSPFAYGKGAEVAEKAKALVAWTTDFNKAVDAANYSDTAADALLADIGKALASPAALGDTEAAMHLSWAYRSLAVARKKDVTKWDGEIGKHLPVEIRSKAAIDASKTPLPAGKFLPDRLKQFANFDPKAFAASMAKLME